MRNVGRVPIFVELAVPRPFGPRSTSRYGAPAFFQRKTHEFSAPLDVGPIVQLIGQAGDLSLRRAQGSPAFTPTALTRQTRLATRPFASPQRPFVGILLKGTSLSTRISAGRPRTRSAMMLRIIFVRAARNAQCRALSNSIDGACRRDLRLRARSRRPGLVDRSRPWRCPASWSLRRACRWNSPDPAVRRAKAPRSRDSRVFEAVGARRPGRKLRAHTRRPRWPASRRRARLRDEIEEFRRRRSQAARRSRGARSSAS